MSGNNGQLNDTDVESMVAFARQVFETAKNTVESMANGDRMQIKQLAETVGVVLSKDTKKVLGFVNHFAHHTDLAYVTRGKNGGLVKGVRPAKIVKAPKKVIVSVATETVDANVSN